MNGITLINQHSPYKNYELNTERENKNDDLLFKPISGEELVFNNLPAHLKPAANNNVFITQFYLSRQDVKDDFEHFYRALRYIMAYEDVELNT